MRGIVMGAALIVAALGTASAQGNDDPRKCVEAVDPDLAVGHCTRALQSRELSRPHLATAFSHRGDAYQTQGAYDLAIRDYDQALALNPNASLTSAPRGTKRSTRDAQLCEIVRGEFGIRQNSH